MGDWEKLSRAKHHSSVCGTLQSRSQSKHNNRDRRTMRNNTTMLQNSRVSNGRTHQAENQRECNLNW
eukprot:12176609-Heterocapsa_arctica.AAC.1